MGAKARAQRLRRMFRATNQGEDKGVLEGETGGTEKQIAGCSGAGGPVLILI